MILSIEKEFKNIANKSRALSKYLVNLLLWRKVELVYFEISPQPHIHHGLVVLEWKVENASSVLLSRFGDVSKQSSIALRLPEGRHLFELKVNGFGGGVVESKEITVERFEILKPEKIEICELDFILLNDKSEYSIQPPNQITVPTIELNASLTLNHLSIKTPVLGINDVILNQDDLIVKREKLEVNIKNIEIDEVELSKIRQINSISTLEKLLNE